MADVPRYVAGSSGVGGSSGRADNQYWNYAVPASNENNSYTQSKDSYINGSDGYNRDDRRPLGQHQHASSRSSQPRGALRPKQSLELAQMSQGTLRPPMTDFGEHSGGSSEADSLLDLYKSSSSNNQATATANGASGSQRKRMASKERTGKVRRKGSRGAVSVMDDTPEEAESKWIHRDKLAQIESREMAAMGIRVGRPSRAGSRAKSTKTNKSVVDAEEMPQDVEMPIDHDAAREATRLRQVADEDFREHHHQSNGSYPGGHAPQRSVDRPSTAARPGTSRIPIPAGMAGSPNDADSPLDLRNSGNLNYQRHNRARSRSDGSQHLLDMASSPTQNGIGSQKLQSSPPKNRNASAPLPRDTKTSATRKASGRQRGDSTTNSPQQRPKTASRPATARPEGEPPWISTMYKPDPRLPPDQQMLPTHAKRMAEMQAQAEARERDGDGPEDTEFTLLESDDSRDSAAEDQRAHENGAINELHKPRDRNSMQRSRNSYHRESYQEPANNRSSWQRTSDLSEQQTSGQWPLRTPSGRDIHPHDRHKSQSPTKQESGAGDHGGYNLMPTIQSPKESQQPQATPATPRMSHRSANSLSNLSEKDREANAAMAPVNQPVRLHEPVEGEEAGKKKKGCMGCCVVM